jgi:hypothetical protein
MSEEIVWRYLRASRRKHALYVVGGEVGRISMCGLVPSRRRDRWLPDDDDPDGPALLALIRPCERCLRWVRR